MKYFVIIIIFISFLNTYGQERMSSYLMVDVTRTKGDYNVHGSFVIPFDKNKINYNQDSLITYINNLDERIYLDESYLLLITNRKDEGRIDLVSKFIKTIKEEKPSDSRFTKHILFDNSYFQISLIEIPFQLKYSYFDYYSTYYVPFFKQEIKNNEIEHGYESVQKLKILTW